MPQAVLEVCLRHGVTWLSDAVEEWNCVVTQFTLLRRGWLFSSVAAWSQSPAPCGSGLCLPVTLTSSELFCTHGTLSVLGVVAVSCAVLCRLLPPGRGSGRGPLLAPSGPGSDPSQGCSGHRKESGVDLALEGRPCALGSSFSQTPFFSDP